MKLSELVKVLGTQFGDAARVLPAGDAAAEADRPIASLHYRAQDVVSGGVFVAIKGMSADGHDFISQALEKGAAAVICEREVEAPVMRIRVPDARKALALAAAAFYGQPTRELTLIGVTGTNGKTTTTYLIESILQAAGFACGVIGTINYRYGGQVFDNPVTTPESLDLQRILADMRRSDVTHAVMEVSSHALDLHRVLGCFFDIGVFTNLTQDHLDYHQTMDAYWASKRRFFDEVLPAAAGCKQPRAVVNSQDPKGRELGATTGLPFLFTGRHPQDDVRALSPRFDLLGVNTTVRVPSGEFQIRSALVGRHNLENILNAVGVGVSLGLGPETIRKGVESLFCVPGRLERVPNDSGRFIYVDYAHTPDALENSLMALRSLTTDRIIAVFGCGGDRDKGKRPKMGEIACRFSDLAVVTSDNPRTEVPETIVEHIVAGIRPLGIVQYAPAELACAGFGAKGYVVEPDRRKAIALSIKASRPGDTLIIAGKGHEPYQIVGRQKLPFDDRQEALRALES